MFNPAHLVESVSGILQLLTNFLPQHICLVTSYTFAKITIESGPQIWKRNSCCMFSSSEGEKKTRKTLA